MDIPYCFSVAVLLISVLSGSTNGNPVVHVPGQKVSYQGSVSDSIEHFQGIMYAHDTSGKRRFAPPEPYIPEVDTIIDASQPGAFCPQVEAALPLLFDETPEMSEDCLSLRIARPAGVSPDSKIPVVVWIHGGGVVKGTAYDSHFNPDKLLALSNADKTPIIYAAINFRMTIFGFPRLSLLKEQKALNLGLRDQRLALQWIKNNIDAFGGDPDRITVYGLSAGGTFSALHTLAYGGEHGVPFQQAWMMSGPPGTALNMTSDATTQHTKNVAKILKCRDSSDSAILECLRAVPLGELLKTSMAYASENHPPLGLFTFIPSVDDDFFPDRQSNLVQQGRFVKGIKMVFRWAHDDGAMNVPDHQAVQSEEDMIAPLHAFASELSTSQLSDLFALYPPDSFKEEPDNYESRKTMTDPSISVHFFRVSRILRDLLFTCSSIDHGYQMVKQTQNLQPGFDSVRLYQLNQSIFTPMLAAAGMPYVQVMHGSDTPYIFNGFPEGDFSEEDQALAAQSSRSLIDFAYSGIPSARGDPTEGSSEWPPAFSIDSLGDEKIIPSEFSMEIVGGPYGTRPVLVKDPEDASTAFGYKMKPQAILNNILDFEGMGTVSESTRERLIQAEELHKRCAFLSTLNQTLGR